MLNKHILAILILTITVSSLKFTFNLQRKDGPRCFHQRLTLNQKYSFTVKSDSTQQYTISLLQQRGAHDMDELFYKKTSKSVESYNKLATVEGEHMFCVSATQDYLQKLEVEILTSLELANIEHLPDLNDQQTLNRQIDWLIQQRGKLFEALHRMESFRSSSQNLTSIMSIKMIIFAILGLVCIIVVNYLFYVEAKKTLKDRKLI